MNVLRHLLLPRAALRRSFPAQVLTEIETAIAKSETQHRAEIRFAIEVALDVAALRRVESARERAHEVFTELRVWDTTERNGVLIYVLLAERKVEIVADRGFEGRVDEGEWRRVCGLIEEAFRDRRWSAGALHGVEAVGGLLIREFPAGGANRNEQPDRPAVL